MCSKRSGTDSAVHFLQYSSGQYPDKVILSIDGIGAFDHISRARMFEQLLAQPKLHELIPFVRLWYATASEFRWMDDQGRSHNIVQGDGGEQGDALMPALFCLALHPALERMRATLPPQCHILAYLDDIYIVSDRVRLLKSWTQLAKSYMKYAT